VCVCECVCVCVCACVCVCVLPACGCSHVDMFAYIYKYRVYEHIYFHIRIYTCMGWLQLVGSSKIQVSFAKKPCKRDYILQKRPIFLRSLLIVATPYIFVCLCWGVCICVCVYVHAHIFTFVYFAPLCHYHKPFSLRWQLLAYGSVLQSVAVRCRVLRCVSVCCRQVTHISRVLPTSQPSSLQNICIRMSKYFFVYECVSDYSCIYVIHECVHVSSKRDLWEISFIG